MDIGISARLRPILDEVKRFIETGILPLEHEFLAEVDTGDRWALTPRQIEILEGLKAQARARGCGRSGACREGRRGRPRHCPQPPPAPPLRRMDPNPAQYRRARR